MTYQDFKTLKVGDGVYVSGRDRDTMDITEVTSIRRRARRIGLLLGGERSYRYVHRTARGKKLGCVSWVCKPSASWSNQYVWL